MTAMHTFGIRHRPEPVAGVSGGLMVRWPSFLGIELELEGVSFNSDVLNRGGTLWDTHDDASLRRGIEFVTSMPIRGGNIADAIDQYYEMVTDFTAGPRTSTHIHVNVSDVDSAVVRSMFFLMYFLEEGVYATTEESRKWAGYSMPLREMRANRIRSILSPLNDGTWREACVGGANCERYYGFNSNWSRHGTVEFRYFPGGPDREELEHWLDLPTTVKQVASRYTVEQLADMFHHEAHLTAFILENFGEWGRAIVNSTSPSVIYQYYQDVASLANDPQEHVRSNIYYVGTKLRNFINRKIFAEDATRIETFNKLLTSEVVSEDSLVAMISMSTNSSLSSVATPNWQRFVQPEEPYFREDDDEEYSDEEDDEDEEEIQEVITLQQMRRQAEEAAMIINSARARPHAPVQRIAERASLFTVTTTAPLLSPDWLDEYTSLVQNYPTPVAAPDGDNN